MFSSVLDSQKMGKVEPCSWDGVINGVAGDEEFENILSILDFPMESLEDDGFVGHWDSSKSQYLGPIPFDVLMGPAMNAQSKIETGSLDLLHRPVSLIDAKPESKQLPHCFEDTSSSCSRRKNNCIEVQQQGLLQSQSPVSVLENSWSLLAGKSSDGNICKRTRSKRGRPSGANPWLLIPSMFSTSGKAYNAGKNKERRRKSSQLPVSMQSMEFSSNKVGNLFQSIDYIESQHAVKKCTHCEVMKTPQWREGPLGPKTLCNACGVRYRSGRLFPEYRPAASPTFVPTLHSNSHKKVIEMRMKGKQQIMT